MNNQRKTVSGNEAVKDFIKLHKIKQTNNTCCFCDHSRGAHEAVQNSRYAICNECENNSITRWHNFVNQDSTCCQLKCKLFIHYHLDNEEELEELFDPNDRPCYPWRSPKGQACSANGRFCVWHRYSDE